MTVEAVAVPGLPEFGAGDDLAAMIAEALAAAGLWLADDDVVVVASKVVAKVEGRSVAAAGRSAAVADQTVRVVASRTLPDGRVTRVVQSRSGPVLAAGGRRRERPGSSSSTTSGGRSTGSAGLSR